MLSFLKENCGIGAEKGRHISKRGQKIIPGQLILQLHVERNSPSCDQPSSSKRTEKENIPKKKANKKRKTKKNIFDDDDWICAGCGDGRRITCDIYSSNYPLECSRIQYPTEYHWDIDLDSREFDALIVLFVFSRISYCKSVFVKLDFFPSIVYLNCLFVFFFFPMGCPISAFCMLEFCLIAPENPVS